MAIKRLYDTLFGATVNANQLAREFSAENWLGNNATVTFTNGVAEMIPNGTYGQLIQYQAKAPNITSGHKYLISFSAKSSGGTNVYSVYNVSGTQYINITPGTNYARYAVVINEANSGSGIRIIFQNNSSDYETLYVKDLILIDLTAYFGSTIADYLYSLETATAGSGLAKLREWGFLRGYQAYNAGSLESVEVTGKVVRGFNQFDKNSSYVKQSYRLFDVPSGKNYKLYITFTDKDTSVDVTGIYFGFVVDNSGSSTSYIWNLNNGNVSNNHSNITNAGQTTGLYCSYAFMYPNTEDAFNRLMQRYDICINLSNADRNGEYEPYVSHTYDYGDDTLRGIFKLDANNNLYADGDVKTSDGVITRKYKKIVIDEDADILTGASGMPFKFKITDKKQTTSTSDLPNAIADKLQVITQASTWGIPFTFSFTLNQEWMYFKLSDSITTIDDAKTWLASNPITLVYELATPTTEQSTPFTSPQICDPDGTEEYVSETGVPVGHETRYQL